MTAPKAPTLTDAKGLGGIIALDGFEYQIWDALARVPAWLRNPAFEGFAVEMLEDFEARFFAPHAPAEHVLDRFQAKSGKLSRAELIDVFESFKAFKAAHPDAARAQTLVTPELSANMRWIARDPGRVRRARPFYSPFADICAASNDKLRKDLIDEFGPELGGFIAESVEIDLRVMANRQSAEATFGAAMHDAFPDLDAGAKKMGATFAALSDLVAQSRGQMLPRDLLLRVLESALGVTLIPDQRLHVNLRSDRIGAVVDAIEIDGSNYSGAGGVFPPPAVWYSGLLVPMIATSGWAKSRHLQRIALSGSYRLSTAVALGWSFRSAIGFEIDIGTKAGVWATDEHPGADTKQLPWKIDYPKRLSNGHLVVCVGVIRDPSLDVQSTRGLSGPDELLVATLPGPIVDGIGGQVSVQALKSAVARSVAQFNPASIDLFIAGPAALAVALGHRWNALPQTQLYEFIAGEHRYVPTLTIG